MFKRNFFIVLFITNIFFVLAAFASSPNPTSKEDAIKILTSFPVGEQQNAGWIHNTRLYDTVYSLRYYKPTLIYVETSFTSDPEIARVLFQWYLRGPSLVDEMAKKTAEGKNRSMMTAGGDGDWAAFATANDERKIRESEAQVLQGLNQIVFRVLRQHLEIFSNEELKSLSRRDLSAEVTRILCQRAGISIELYRGTLSLIEAKAILDQLYDEKMGYDPSALVYTQVARRLDDPQVMLTPEEIALIRKAFAADPTVVSSFRVPMEAFGMMLLKTLEKKSNQLIESLDLQNDVFKGLPFWSKILPPIRYLGVIADFINNGLTAETITTKIDLLMREKDESFVDRLFDISPLSANPDFLYEYLIATTLSKLGDAPHVRRHLFKFLLKVSPAIAERASEPIIDDKDGNKFTLGQLFTIYLTDVQKGLLPDERSQLRQVLKNTKRSFGSNAQAEQFFSRQIWFEARRSVSRSKLLFTCMEALDSLVR